MSAEAVREPRAVQPVHTEGMAPVFRVISTDEDVERVPFSCERLQICRLSRFVTINVS